MTDAVVPARVVVAADLAEKINAKLLELMTSAAKCALELGDLLNQAKRKVGHGNFERWLGQTCGGLSKSTAERYMKYAANRPKIEVELAGKNVKLTDLKLGDLDQIVKDGKAPTTQKSPAAKAREKADRAKDNFLEKLKDLRTNHDDAATAKNLASNMYHDLMAADFLEPRR